MKHFLIGLFLFIGLALANLSQANSAKLMGSFSITENRILLVVSSEKPIESQLLLDNTIYEIRDVINLDGKQITIPRFCDLRFVGKGKLINGTIVGNLTTITGNMTGVLKDVRVEGTFTNDSVSTTVFSNTPDLKSLIHLAGEGGIIELNTDVFHDGYSFVLNKSLTIKGDGHTIKIKGEGIKSGSLFDVKGINKLEIENIVFDGGLDKDVYRKGKLRKQSNYKWLLSAEDCKSISITDCVFKNFFFQMAHNTNYPYQLNDPNALVGLKKREKQEIIRNSLYSLAHYAMISFVYCDYVVMTGNKFENVNSEEGVVFLGDNSFKYPIKASKNGRFIAKNNKFICNSSFSEKINCYSPDESTVSTWITVLYGQCEISSNEFGACQGSQINAFCENSLIEGNVFYGSKNGSIDLNENGFLGFYPCNVIVKHNQAYNTLYFVNFSAGKDITIVDNTFDCSGVPQGYGSSTNVFAFFNRNTKDAYAPLTLFHPINNVTIRRNKSINAVWFLCDWNYGERKGEKKHILVDSNAIVNRNTYAKIDNDRTISTDIQSGRAAITFSSFEDVQITNNVIQGTGSPTANISDMENKSKKLPSFISILQPSKKSYFKNVVIDNNQFENGEYGTVLMSYKILDEDLSKNKKYRRGVRITNIRSANNELVTNNFIQIK